MALIEGFRIQNYKALKDITLGRLWNQRPNPALTPLVVVIGKNGVGKSTLFDAFGFLSDALNAGVEEACDMKGRGGFDKLISAGSGNFIRFEIYYKEDSKASPITYELTITRDNLKRPYVKEERLRQRRKGKSKGKPLSFLRLENGEGEAWAGESSGEGEELTKVPVALTDSRKLGIATLGALKEHPRITKFKNFLGNWYLSYFTPDAARSLPLAGPQKHLNVHGDNLANVVQYLEQNYPESFKKILQRISSKIPGIRKIDTRKTEDGRLLLRFNDQGFTDPFFAQQMSDGTLKYFAYMLLLEDPDPPPFICIEEPENGLYHKLLESLATEFRNHSTVKKRTAQIFITTHQPYFVDALRPEEVWVLEKDQNGFAIITHASDNEIIRNMVAEGLPLGGLWYSDYLDNRDN